jgi:hypothetical protein
VPDTDASLDALEYRGADRALVQTLFDELGWQSILDRVPCWAEG